MTHSEKILTAALFRCACTLAHTTGKLSPPRTPLSVKEQYENETAVAIAAMNLSLRDAKEEPEVWLRRMEEGYLAYRRLGGEDIDKMED